MKVLEIILAAVSAIAAVVSVVAAINTSNTETRLKENLEVATSLSEWAKNLNNTGAQCAAMLSQFSQEQFKDFSNRASFKLLSEQKQFLGRCTVAYESGVFDKEGDLVITEKERSYIADQVLRQLNTYEALALKWVSLSEEGKATICAQAKIAANSPYRTFFAVAKGTDWWNYPKLEEFMLGCTN